MLIQGASLERRQRFQSFANATGFLVKESSMKARIALVGAAVAALSMAAMAMPANAQRYYYRDYDDYGRTVTRCDRDGDRCATYRCDRDGDECRRISGWYARSY